LALKTAKASKTVERPKRSGLRWTSEPVRRLRKLKEISPFPGRESKENLRSSLPSQEESSNTLGRGRCTTVGLARELLEEPPKKR
jgi:hypothetical protein